MQPSKDDTDNHIDSTDNQSNNNQSNNNPSNDHAQSTIEADTYLSLFMVYLKGIAMGMADIVPGVSGGTIALITGVYQRLINAISSVDIALFKMWKQQGLIKGFVSVWKHLDATFVLCLALGIGTSFMTLAGLITHYLENEPLKIWSLFFGLVIATVVVLLRDIQLKHTPTETANNHDNKVNAIAKTRWHWQRIGLFALGTLIAITISSLPMVSGTPSLPYLFFAGAIAICAMILPGVSGSFILLLLGAYQAVLDAVHGRDIMTIAVVMLGMLTGLLIFSKFLKWLLAHYYQPTLALLTGFIAGSLVKIYPWKVEVSGVLTNVAPSAYPTGPNWASSLMLMVLGAGIVFALSWWGKQQK